MNPDGEGLSGAEDLIDAEIEASQTESPLGEKEVRDAVQKLPGISSLEIRHGKVSVRYDPTLTSQKHISEAVAAAGHPVEKMEVSRGPGHADSPPPTP